MQNVSEGAQKCLIQYQNNPDIYCVDDLFVFKKEDSNIQIIWCFLCDDHDVTQDSQGNYMIKNESLIMLDNMPGLKNKNTIPDEVLMNIWICPACKRAILKLSPQFDLGGTYVSI